MAAAGVYDLDATKGGFAMTKSYAVLLTVAGLLISSPPSGAQDIPLSIPQAVIVDKDDQVVGQLVSIGDSSIAGEVGLPLVLIQLEGKLVPVAFDEDGPRHANYVVRFDQDDCEGTAFFQGDATTNSFSAMNGGLQVAFVGPTVATSHWRAYKPSGDPGIVGTEESKWVSNSQTCDDVSGSIFWTPAVEIPNALVDLEAPFSVKPCCPSPTP